MLLAIFLTVLVTCLSDKGGGVGPNLGPNSRTLDTALGSSDPVRLTTVAIYKLWWSDCPLLLSVMRVSEGMDPPLFGGRREDAFVLPFAFSFPYSLPWPPLLAPVPYL